MDDEGLPDHVGIGRCMAVYTYRVNPRQPARACGCCGEADVPATLHDSESRGILSFTKNPVDNSQLEPLWYTSAEKQNFERIVPAHIEDTAVNHDLWLRFRNIFRRSKSALRRGVSISTPNS